MDDDSDLLEHRKAWPDEDRTPTSHRELQGFYCYSIAAEVYAVTGVGAFLPVTLEQLARQNGVLFSDRTRPCVSSGIRSTSLMARVVDGSRDPDQCLIRVLGMDITTASFAMYTFSAAVLCQAIVLVSFSAFADYGDSRKRLLFGFGIVGALTSISFIFVVPSLYLLGSLLVVLGVICLGSSFVLLNSYLPLLAANHPTTHSHVEEFSRTIRAVDTSELHIATTISSKAVTLGYSAAIFVQILSIGLLVVTKRLAAASPTLPLRLILVLTGVWWLAFMIPAYFWLRTRPGPPFGDAKSGHTERRSIMGHLLANVKFAWSSLWRTIKLAFKLKQVVVFLSAWFLISDAQASVSGTAVLFARTELGLGSVGIAILSITVMVSGILGSTVFPIISKLMRWQSNQTVVVCLLLMEFVPLYGLSGYLPFVQRWGVGGLQVWWEIYICAFVFGVVMGGLSSYCRSLYGSLIPAGSEAAFFALFAITDKGSSAIGPAVVGRIVDATGHIRPAFWFLAFLIAMPIPLVWSVDVCDGQAAAARVAGKLSRVHGSDLLLQHNDRAEGEGLIEDSEDH